MGLLSPEPTLEAVLTQYENGQIIFQFMSFTGPHTAEQVKRLLATVLRNLSDQDGNGLPPIRTPELFAQEMKG